MNGSTMNDSKMNGSKFTPPDSPSWKARSVSFLPNHDDETLTLIGTTKFEPRSDIKNILITGGAGFMFVDP
jgi:dTDP-glucose 4,6-dehydratase